MQTLVDSIAADPQLLSYLCGIVAFKPQLHQPSVFVAKGSGHVGRQSHKGGGGAAVQMVEYRARMPEHPGTFLQRARTGPQPAVVLPQREAHLLHQVAATLKVAAGTSPAEPPDQRAVAPEQLGV